MNRISRVDFLGTILLLSATILLVAALEETANEYKWRSAFVITALVVSGLSWILFLAWSWKVTPREGVLEPIFPWRFMQNRVFSGLLLYELSQDCGSAQRKGICSLVPRCVFLTGAPLTVCIVQIPLRFQIVNSLSALQASIRLLPFALLLPVGSIATAALAGKAKIPPVYLFIIASALQTAGCALLSISPTTGNISKAQYGYQAISGIAIGSNLATVTVMTPFTVEKRDKCKALIPRT
jgi:hypothetical protein